MPVAGKVASICSEHPESRATPFLNSAEVLEAECFFQNFLILISSELIITFKRF
jgi:hypothetical protein